MKHLLNAALLVAVTATTGCASIFTDSSATLNLATSNGNKTTLTIDGQVFNAPGVVIVQKNGMDKMIVADSDTCKGQTVAPRKIEVAFWANILSGGLFGSTTDYSTSKMWTYDTNIIVNCGS